MVGQTLSHFRITAKLGEGGMGEVYRAEDTKLGREVAIKVLPEALTSDEERLARFDREARVLAALNHANVAAIYEVGRSGEVHFLAMELAEGEDLEAVLGRGAVPVDEALEVARQIAAALEAAHDSGIVHRDLKPANIKVAPDGQVKVLDFGLAKAWQDYEEDPRALSMSPTLTAAMTGQGVILGTAAYMSPEQARGKPVDRRTDIWSFGVILFEMLTGERLFSGESVTDVLAAVIGFEPEWGRLPDETPAPVSRLLRRCLRHDPRRRLRDAGDMLLDLDADPDEEIGVKSAVAGGREVRSPASPLRRGLAAAPWVVATVAVLAAVGMWLGRDSGSGDSEPIVRMTIERPTASLLLRGYLGSPVGISPDGREVVLVTGDSEMYRKSLEQAEPTPIRGTANGVLPFYSPDGAWMGFFADGEIRKMQRPDGRPETVFVLEPESAGERGERGATWTDSGSIVFAMSQESGLYEVSEEGGEARAVTTLAEDERSHRWPAAIAGRGAVLFTVEQSRDLNFDEASIDVVVLKSGERRTLVEDAAYPRYAASGHLLYVRSGALVASPFDAETLEITGPEAEIFAPILFHHPSGTAGYSVSAEGSLIVMPAFQEPLNDLLAMSSDGSTQLLWEPDRQITSVRVRPDGAVVAAAVDGDVWLFDRGRGLATRATSDLNTFGSMTWSPEGDRLAVGAQPRGLTLPSAFIVSASGDVEPRRMLDDDFWRAPISWIADGRLSLADDFQIFEVEPDGDRVVRPLLESPFNLGDPHFSPDGEMLAYTSDESGSGEIYIRRLQGSSGKTRVSTAGGWMPTWSPDGASLYFLSDAGLMATRVTAAPEVKTSLPRVLISQPWYRSADANFRTYDLIPGTESFVFLRPRETPDTPAAILTLNWFAELDRLAPR